jgi:hypothetical protein
MGRREKSLSFDFGDIDDIMVAGNGELLLMRIMVMIIVIKNIVFEGWIALPDTLDEFLIIIPIVGSLVALYGFNEAFIGICIRSLDILLLFNLKLRRRLHQLIALR